MPSPLGRLSKRESEERRKKERDEYERKLVRENFERKIEERERREERGRGRDIVFDFDSTKLRDESGRRSEGVRGSC